MLPLETKNFSTENGKFLIDKMDIELNELRIRISRTPGPTITIGSSVYKLQELGKPGELLIFKSGRIADLFVL